MNAPATFNDFVTRNRGLLVRHAARAGVEFADAQQEAWLAWDRACRTWSPAGGASLNTWATKVLKWRLLKLAEQKRFGIELDADDAPDLAAWDEEQITAWRGELRRLGGEVESLFDLLRLGGCAALGQAIGRCERRARQLIKEIEDAPQHQRLRKLRALALRVARGPHWRAPARPAVQLQLDLGEV